jgi:hypothetical protein
MKLTAKGKFYAILIGLSLFFSYFIVSLGYFPHSGFALVFSILALLIYIKNKASKTKFYFLSVLLLSIFMLIRSGGLITFINFFSSIYLGSFLILAVKEKEPQTILQTLLAPLQVIFPAILTSNEYSLEVIKTDKKTNIGNSLLITLITLLMLGIVIPILNSANPIFARFVNKVFDLSGFFKWLLSFEELTLTTIIFRIMLFIGFLIFLPRLFSYLNSKNKEPQKSETNININLLIPKIALVLILLIFFVTQIQLYLSSEETLALMGYSHSQYAREVFTQLSIVSLIIFLLLYNDESKVKNNKITSVILLIQGFFLILMALKSDFDYSAQFGFTEKRLYGFVIAGWLSGLLALLYKFHFKAINNKKLFFNGIVFTISVVLLVNILNFDYIIYHYNKSSLGYRIDYQYLARLSADSLSYKAQLDELTKLKSQNINNPEMQSAIASAGTSLIYKITLLQNKYKKLQWQQFSLLDYLQYKEIKQIDSESKMQEFRDYLNRLNN